MKFYFSGNPTFFVGPRGETGPQGETGDGISPEERTQINIAVSAVDMFEQNMSTISQNVTDSENYANSALTSATNSETFAEQASDHATNAEGYSIVAVESMESANTFANQALISSNNSLNYSISANTSRADAQTFANAANTARTDAQTYSASANTSRVAAETARIGAETARNDAENISFRVAATSSSQPWTFINGLNYWTTGRGSSPVANPTASKLTLVTDDTVYGSAGNWATTAAGDNVMTRGVSLWSGRAYKVTIKFRILSSLSPTVSLNIAAVGLSPAFDTSLLAGSTATNFTVFDGTEQTLTTTFAYDSSMGADTTLATMHPNLYPYIRFGLRSATSTTTVVRIGSITVEEVTSDLQFNSTKVETTIFTSRENALASRIPVTVGSIKVLHDGEIIEYQRKPASMANTSCPLRTTDGAYWIPFGDATLRHWGAISDVVVGGDGISFTGTDCRQMFTDMMVWARTNSKSIVRINAGNFLIRKPATGAVISISNTGNLEILGAGMWASTLYFADSQVSTGDGRPCLSQRTDTYLDYLHMADFGIVSDYGYNGFWDDTSHAAAFSSPNKKVIVERLRFQSICQMNLVLSNCEDATVTECYFHRSQRDGCHLVNNSRIKVTNNQFRQIGDDSIVFSRTTEGILPFSAVITGNLIEDSQGIYGTGYDSVIVTNNIVRRPHIRGIEILRSSNWGETRGRVPRINYIISDNIVTDVFKRGRFGGSGIEWAYIAVGDSSYPTYEQALSLGKISPLTDGSYVWGSNGTAVNNPSSQFHKEGNTVGNINITVSNNICMRTLEPTANYSDYGFGPRYVQDVGPYDGNVIEDDFYGTHIAVRGTMRNVKISGNLSYGATTPVEVWGFMEGVIPDWDGLTFESNKIMNIRGNQAFDIIGHGVVTFRNNEIDGDTFHNHTSRTANGTWNSTTAQVAYKVQNATVILDGGSYKNISSIYNALSGTVKHTPNPVTLHGNFLALGDNALNGGIRVVPKNVPIIYSKINTDKTSIDFNKVISLTTTTTGDEMPSSGHYLTGQKIDAITPIIRVNEIVIGWIRKTTGNNHVVNVDWEELKFTR